MFGIRTAVTLPNFYTIHSSAFNIYEMLRNFLSLISLNEVECLKLPNRKISMLENHSNLKLCCHALLRRKNHTNASK